MITRTLFTDFREAYDALEEAEENLREELRPIWDRISRPYQHLAEIKPYGDGLHLVTQDRDNEDVNYFLTGEDLAARDTALSYITRTTAAENERLRKRGEDARAAQRAALKIELARIPPADREALLKEIDA